MWMEWRPSMVWRTNSRTVCVLNVGSSNSRKRIKHTLAPFGVRYYCKHDERQKWGETDLNVMFSCKSQEKKQVSCASLVARHITHAVVPLIHLFKRFVHGELVRYLLACVQHTVWGVFRCEPTDRPTNGSRMEYDLYERWPHGKFRMQNNHIFARNMNRPPAVRTVVNSYPFKGNLRISPKQSLLSTTIFSLLSIQFRNFSKQSAFVSNK